VELIVYHFQHQGAFIRKPSFFIRRSVWGFRYDTGIPLWSEMSLFENEMLSILLYEWFTQSGGHKQIEFVQTRFLC